MERYEKAFGKVVEDNVIESLRMAGAPLKRSWDLDHNYKIDFVLKLKGQDVGIQFSLNNKDMVKAKVAKICALDAVPRFMYLSLPGFYFKQPDKQNGHSLYRYLNNVANKHKEKALFINIGRNGPRIQIL